MQLVHRVSAWLREDSSESVDFVGCKSITFIGGVFLLLNTAVGPGLAFLPILYQQTGLLTCSIIILFLTFTSCILCMTLVEIIQKIPDNDDFSLRIEYLDLIKYYCEPIECVNKLSLDLNGTPTHHVHTRQLFQSQLLSTIAQIMFYLFMITLIITNIIQCCQAIDVLISHLFGASCAFQFYPRFMYTDGTNNSNPFNPFNGDSYVLSAGTIVVMICIIPFCVRELSEIMWMQYMSVYGLMVLVSLMLILFPFSDTFMMTPSQSNLTNFNVDGIGNLLPLQFFNFSFIVTIPSWINEKHTDVSYSAVLKVSCISIACVFITIGIINALGFYYDYNTNQSMIYQWIHFSSSSMDTLVVSFVSNLIGYVYPILECLSSVPVYCAIIRYNLLNTRCVRSVFTCNLLVIVLPFFVSIIAYHYDSYLYIMCWSGLFLSYAINFVLPTLFYYIMLTRPDHVWDDVMGSVLHQQQLHRSPSNTRKALYHHRNIKYSVSSLADEHIDNVGLLQHQTIEDYGAVTPRVSPVVSLKEDALEVEELKLDQNVTDTPTLKTKTSKSILILPRRSSASFDPQTPSKQMGNNYYFHGVQAMHSRHTKINKTMYDSPIMNPTKTMYMLLFWLALFVVCCVLAFAAVVS